MLTEPQLEKVVSVLRPILGSVRSQEDELLRQISEAKDAVTSRYGQLFRPESVANISEEDFRGFLLFENNHHWPLHRQGKSICSDMERLRRALLLLVDETRPIEERLNELRDKNGDLRVNGLAKGILTAILHVAHPTRYAVWNRTTEAGMKRAGVWPAIPASRPLGERYVAINSILLQIAEALETDLWTLDSLWYRLENPAEGAAQAVREAPEAHEEVPTESELQEIESLVLGLIPDPELRAQILSLLADSIDQASRAGASKWAATVTQRGLSLNVGRLLIVRIEPEAWKAAVAVDLLDESQTSEIAEVGSWGYRFRSAPGIQVIELPHEAAPRVYKNVDNAIYEAIRVGSQIKQTPYFASHSSALMAWLEKELNRTLPRPSYTTPYWMVMVRPESAWDACRAAGCISLGWPELGDLSELTDADFQERAATVPNAAPEHAATTVRSVLEFSRIPVGAFIVAGSGTSEVLGLGRVTGAYEFSEGQPQPHRLSVDWVDTDRRSVNQPGWRHPVVSLTEATFEKIRDIRPSEAEADTGEFTDETFELLSSLSESPTREFYAQHQEALQRHVEAPLQTLLKSVKPALPAEARSVLETEKGLFSRIPKNDYGRGGAWPFYWGAFYPAGGRRISSPQLFVSIHEDKLSMGFMVGLYSPASEERWRSLVADTSDLTKLAFERSLEDLGLLFGTRAEREAGDGYGSLEEWIAAWDGKSAPLVQRILSKEEVLEHTMDELVEEVARLFAALFPFVLIATLEDPWSSIAAYLGVEEKAGDLQPAYSLSDLRSETGFPTEQLQNWVRVLRRKKQVILQGPPGTGKTFVAQRLARMLVSESAGCWELVQFHPAYAYEDFIQGLRPEVQDGGLSYSLEPGAFLKFCERAARTPDSPCVLIVDEINRANLARVFGELMYLLEYRDKQIRLAAGGREFTVPENVHIIGTMNTADRSITRMDHAMRRRFSFVRLTPEYEVLRSHLAHHGLPGDSLVEVLKNVNQEIDDRNFEVGISYFMTEDERLREHLGDIWQAEIEPYLDEYFYDQPKRVDRFRWRRLKEDELRDWS